ERAAAADRECADGGVAGENSSAAQGERAARGGAVELELSAGDLRRTGIVVRSGERQRAAAAFGEPAAAGQLPREAGRSHLRDGERVSAAKIDRAAGTAERGDGLCGVVEVEHPAIDGKRTARA